MASGSRTRAAAGTVRAAAIASGALVAQIVAGKATRDALFLAEYGLELLPAAMIGAALLSSIAMVVLSRALTRHGPARVVPTSFASGALLFLCESWVCVRDPRLAAALVYAHTAIFGASVASAFWSLVNERFDPHSAKKLVGRIAGGGTIGGVAGGLVAWRASEDLTLPTMLVLLSAMNIVGLWATLRIAPASGRGAALPRGVVTSGGARVLRETPYLRDLALLVAACAVVNALLDWLLSAHATTVFGRGPKLLGFFALFNMAVGVLSFAVQTGLTRPILERMGLGAAVKAQPASVGLGIGIALVAPTFAAVVVLRGLEAVTKSSLYRSAYELFYTPLPPAKKRATKTLIDVGVDRLGTLIGSAGLLAIAQLSAPVATKVVLFSALAVAALSWYVASRLQAGYVSALAASLRSGAVVLDAGPGDLTTRRTLAEASALLEPRDEDVVEAPIETSDPILVKASVLASDDTARIKRILAKPIPQALAPHVVALLPNDAVVRDVVRALRRSAPKTTGLLLDHLLDPEVDVRVRRRIPRVLRASRTPRAAAGLVDALRDPAFEVRVEVGLALARVAEDPAVKLDHERVFELAHRELTEGRRGWSAGDDPGEPPLDRGLSHVFLLLGLALDPEPLSIAYRAVRGDDPALRGTALEYLDVTLPRRVRDVLVPLLGDVERAAGRDRRGSNELAAELLRSDASRPKARGP